MSRVFRRDPESWRTFVPEVIDVRSKGATVGGAFAWVEADAKPAEGRWIAPIIDGAVPSGADALVHDGALTSEEARTLPLYCDDPRNVPGDHPGPIVLTRLAAYPCDADRLLATLDRMDGDPRLLLETSGASISGFIAAAVGRHPERVMFGSGAPVFDANAQVLHVAAALPDDGALRRVLHDNAVQWLGASR